MCHFDEIKILPLQYIPGESPDDYMKSLTAPCGGPARQIRGVG